MLKRYFFIFHASCSPRSKTENIERFRELDEMGVSLESIRRFFGHKNISTTQGYLRGKKRTQVRRELIEKDVHFQDVKRRIDMLISKDVNEKNQIVRKDRI